MPVRRFLLLASVGLAVASAGCGGGGPAVAEVEGTVKLKGKPLEKIQVEFWPVGDGPRSMGTTDANGRYVLTTDGSRQGAVVGRHRVVLKDVGVLGTKFMGRAGETVDMAKGKKAQITNTYADPHKTPVTKDVTAGKCVIDIDLDAP